MAGIVHPVTGAEQATGVRNDTPANLATVDGAPETFQFSGGRLWGSVVVTAISAGETQLGFVGGAAVRVFGTLNALSPVLAAAGDYAAGDVLSDSATNGAGHAFEFAGMGRVAAGSGIITKAIITTSVEAWSPTMRLWLFHTTPSGCELDDNAALSIVVADRAKLVGYIDFAAGADIGTISYTQNTDVRLSYKCAAADTKLYGILQVTEAVTNESASMTLTIELHALQD